MTNSAFAGERLAKRIARAGICSRRDAEKLVEEGKVKVDGKVVRSPALNVTAENAIEVSGQKLKQAAATQLWLYYKPLHLITTHKDPEGRPTVFDALPKSMPRVISVGRLDINSEGLLLLTNDGGLARYVELPATGWLRRYRVRAHGTLNEKQIADLKKGLTIDGMNYGSVDVTIERKTGTNSWILVSLREGKNREVRKLLEHFDCQVNRLIRISDGPFQIGNMQPGEVREVPRKVLASFLGSKFPLTK